MQETFCYTHTHTHTHRQKCTNFTMSRSNLQILSTRRVTQAISIRRTHKYQAPPTKFSLYGDQARGICAPLCTELNCQNGNMHTTSPSHLHNSTPFRFQLQVQQTLLHLPSEKQYFCSVLIPKISRRHEPPVTLISTTIVTVNP